MCRVKIVVVFLFALLFVSCETNQHKISELNSLIYDLNIRVSDLVAENEELKQEIENLEQENQIYQTQIDNDKYYYNQKKILDEEFRQLESDNESWDKKFLNDEIEMLKAQIDVLNNVIKNRDEIIEKLENGR